MLTEHDLFDLLALLNGGTEPVVGDVDHHGRAFELFSGARGATTAEDLARGLAELGLEQDEGPEEAEAYLAELASDLTSGGAVLAIDEQGFRTVDVYTTAEELAEAWADAEAYITEREQEAEAELEREVRAAVDADLPEAWTLAHHASTGCSACPRKFETEAEARQALERALELLREDGFEVNGPVDLPESEQESGQGFGVLRVWAEVHEPEEALLVPDEAGILSIYWNGPAREAEVERRLERARY